MSIRITAATEVPHLPNRHIRAWRRRFCLHKAYRALSQPRCRRGDGRYGFDGILYNTPSQQDVNIYVINSIDPYPYSFNAWNPFYNPYRYTWGPSWSFGWGYDPWFDISWGWVILVSRMGSFVELGRHGLGPFGDGIPVIIILASGSSSRNTSSDASGSWLGFELSSCTASAQASYSGSPTEIRPTTTPATAIPHRLVRQQRASVERLGSYDRPGNNGSGSGVRPSSPTKL